MASKKMTAEQKKVENMIHKINRRLVRMAQSGMELSPVFGAISESILDAGKAASKAEFKASGSTDPDDLKSPFRYTKVTAADGTIINVMQLSRSTWMLNNMTLEMLQAADALGTGKAEKTAMKNYLQTKDPGRKITDKDIGDAFGSEWMKGDFMNYIWDYLYVMQDVKSVRDFFDTIIGEKLTTPLGNNQEAINLYNKLVKQKKGKKEDARFRGVIDDLRAAIKSGDVAEQTRLAMQYLIDTNYTKKPTKDEIEGVIRKFRVK